MNSNPFNFQYQGVGHNDNSNLDNIQFKRGDLVKMEIVPRTFVIGFVDEIRLGRYGYPINYKLISENGVIHKIDSDRLISVEIIKTRQQLLDDKKVQYPITFKALHNITISINENQSAKLSITYANSKEERIVDLSIFTNEEIINLYKKDRDKLATFIINKSTIGIYDTKIDDLLLKVSELENDQNKLYDISDNLIKEFKKVITNS